MRATSLQELAYFIEETLLKEFKVRGKDCEKDLTLLCGDFNIYRDRLNEHIIKRLFMKDKDWVDFLGAYEREYSQMLTTLQLGGAVEVVDLWSEHQPAAKCVSYGEIKIELGKEVPFDTILTDENDLMCDNCFDYVFQVKPNFSSPDFAGPDDSHHNTSKPVDGGNPIESVVCNSIKVEKNLVKIGEMGAYGKKRAYG